MRAAGRRPGRRGRRDCGQRQAVGWAGDVWRGALERWSGGVVDAGVGAYSRRARPQQRAAQVGGGLTQRAHQAITLYSVQRLVLKLCDNDHMQSWPRGVLGFRCCGAAEDGMDEKRMR